MPIAIRSFFAPWHVLSPATFFLRVFFLELVWPADSQACERVRVCLIPLLLDCACVLFLMPVVFAKRKRRHVFTIVIRQQRKRLNTLGKSPLLQTSRRYTKNESKCLPGDKSKVDRVVRMLLLARLCWIGLIHGLGHSHIYQGHTSSHPCPPTAWIKCLTFFSLSWVTPALLSRLFFYSDWLRCDDEHGLAQILIEPTLVCISCKYLHAHSQSLFVSYLSHPSNPFVLVSRASSFHT